MPTTSHISNIIQILIPSVGRVLALLFLSLVNGKNQSIVENEDLSGEIFPDWYPVKTFGVFDEFLRRKLKDYEKSGLATDDWVESSLKLGACTDCDPNEARWNTHFKIVNGTAYSVGGIPTFWNDHHRKRVKSVFMVLSKLLELEPNLPDVEFVVNFHDYNKLPREESLAWGGENRKSLFADVDQRIDQPQASEESAGSFKEHLNQWPGQDWELYYRVYGNHFGNPPVHTNQGSGSIVDIWSTFV